MYLAGVLFENGEVPNTSLSWLLYFGAAFLFLTIAVGWLRGGSLDQKKKTPHHDRESTEGVKRQLRRTGKSK